MSKQNKINLEKQIMAKVKSGQVKMKSSLNILAEKLGLGSGLILAGLSLTLILACLIYWFRANSDLMALPIGRGHGPRLFFQTFPYLWLITFIVLFVLFSWLLKKYDFSYKKPLLIILAFLSALLLVFSLFFQRQPVLTSFLQKRLPLIYAPKDNQLGFIIGEVIAKTKNQLTLNTENNQRYQITFNKETHFSKKPIAVGDMVRVVGVINKQKVEAKAILNLSGQKQLFKITPFRHRKRLINPDIN